MTWPVPKFGYGQHVRVIPLERVEARVVDLHWISSVGSLEYEVRYFADSKECKVRVFEDELEDAEYPSKKETKDV